MRYVICFALLGLVACDAPSTDSRDFTEAQARQMLAFVTRSEDFGTIPNQCPLGLYQSRPASVADVPDCARQPRACLDLCASGVADACFDAALVMDFSDLEPVGEGTFPLYMAACARGDANACVNAGATVKNGSWSGARPSAAGTAQCQFQTYERMCKDGASWGCYMVAQEYRRSDGFRPASETRYTANMRRACELAPKSGACLSEFR